MLNIRDTHDYFYPDLERRALVVKQRWIGHLQVAHLLLRDQARFGPQYSSLGVNLIRVAQQIGQEEAALSALVDADISVRRATTGGSEHDGD